MAAWHQLHPKQRTYREPGGALSNVEGTLIRLRVSRLPGRRDREPKTVWLWWHGDDPASLDLNRVWRAYLRRFDIEHTFRFAKQSLGWTTPKLRTPEQADRWTWLILAALTQLSTGSIVLAGTATILAIRRSPAGTPIRSTQEETDDEMVRVWRNTGWPSTATASSSARDAEAGRPRPPRSTGRSATMRDVDDRLRTLLSELFEQGRAHDTAEPDRRRRLRNLEPATAALLTLVLRIARARDIVEIGTSNGYSAIWLAAAARDTGGHVTTVDVEEWPGVVENLDRAAVSVQREIADGGRFLVGRANASVDLLFLDAERVEYTRWWPHPARVLRPGGLLAIDNVLSHPDEVAGVLRLIAADGRFAAETVAVGKGLHLAYLQAS
ncbi:hypothetical protein Aau02nite_47950 [Amorphoplanes auranticolor]|uniref:O-methyltransferase YrrM n=1 Tax=Actinoplanes auranticolor TaxID=47988 RepID=A0A919VWH6_9ACTN|nr:class I SAM-dependent methyltransferase [Actinoplanes auranticolor]GIM71833.1 hypothetical protein Aau02nite_47950 [Actinoplanes auranticolor]